MIRLYNRFNLNYLTNLGVNCSSGFEPSIHSGIAGGINSMYCVKKLFLRVNSLMSKANTRPAGMTEFQGFVAAADRRQ